MPRKIRAMAMIIAIAVAAASCTEDGSERPPPKTSSSPTAASLDRFELAADPLWRGDAASLPEAMRASWDSAKFIDDVLLLEHGTAPVAVVNPATGEPYWATDPLTRLGNNDVEMSSTTGRAPLTQVGGEWAMLVTYRTGRHTDGAQVERFTATVRVKDASLLWKAPASADSYEIMTADDRAVLLAIGSRLGSPTAQALSAADGSLLWEASGVWPQFAVGDRVLGAVSSKYPELGAEDSYVVGLDAATGQRMWSLEGRYRRSQIGLVAGEVALVYARPASGAAERDSIVLLDVVTGAEITRLGWDLGARCAGDGERLIACVVDETPERPNSDPARLVTFDVERRTKHVAPPATEIDGVTVRRIWRDYLFVQDGLKGDWWAVDRNGIAVSDKLPGQLIGVADEYVAVKLVDEGGIAAFYQRKK